MVVGRGQGKVGCDPAAIIDQLGKHPRVVQTNDFGHWSVKDGSLRSLSHEESEDAFGRELVIWWHTKHPCAVAAQQLVALPDFTKQLSGVRNDVLTVVAGHPLIVRLGT